MIALVYIILTLAGLAGAAFTYFKSDRKADVAIIFAVAAALVMLADWVAYGWFSLYDYHPQLLADTLADSALGEFLADILFVPSLTVVLVSYAPGLTGIVLGTAAVTGLEILLLNLGIFHHHGWALWGTVVGFLFYLAVLDLFCHDLRQEQLPLGRLRWIVRICLVFDMIALLTLYLRAERAVVTNIAILPTYIGNQALGRFIWYVVVMLPPACWALTGKGARRWWRIAALIPLLLITDWVLAVIGIQHFEDAWNSLLDAVAQAAAFVAAGLLEDLLLGQCKLLRSRGKSQHDLS